MNTMFEQLNKYKEINFKDREINIKELKENIKRGDIWYANLPKEGKKGEQSGIRPVVIIQNDIGNEHAPTVIVACITSKTDKYKKVPTHVLIQGHGLKSESVILLEQVRTINKERLLTYMGHADELLMKRVDKAKDISMGDIKPKTTLEKLHKDIQRYLCSKIKTIKTYEIVIEKLNYLKADSYSINLAEDEKFKEENSIRCYCDKNDIDYFEILDNYNQLYCKEGEYIAL